MTRFIHLVTAAAAGMAAMYYLDPEHGERRRAAMCAKACACCHCARGGSEGELRGDPAQAADLAGPGGGVGTAP
ncbi:hypothetical protein [Paraburkholderia acidisoli]|uniref:Uncharacterized protein n=1 Tax=Paraburkholderia acidisoli TaxID=2571748 RepID=A0A7Z2GS75_9BURK|nr:hypothetical protein [Paraburkholderia acidisoli]QGZ66619.1 hypothetical protein FAZ98_33230 [Paraburkholderia acidisoli]